MPVRRRKLFITGGVITALLAVLLALAVWYQFFRDDAPARVSIDSAVAAAGATSTTGSQSSAVETLNGTWVLGENSEQFVGYRIGEELASIGTTEAVGRTSAVAGSATIEGQTLTSTTLTADMTSLRSDQSRRDNALRSQSLETSRFPEAIFELTASVALPETLADGDAVSIAATGNLTLHGVTREITLPLDVQRIGDTLVLVGSLDITLADYNIAKPRAPSVVSVEDSGVLELQLYFERAG
jgi:polyisoprenoid-binding protein YceI